MVGCLPFFQILPIKKDLFVRTGLLMNRILLISTITYNPSSTVSIGIRIITTSYSTKSRVEVINKANGFVSMFNSNSHIAINIQYCLPL